MTQSDTIAFQGVPGAYSDLACRTVFPEVRSLPCESFEEAFAAVHEGRARHAMIPVENSIAGRVADIHSLLPDGGLYIVGEHFQRVNHHLMAVPGASLETITEVRSHIQALSQCRHHIAALDLKPVQHYDTAGAAADVAKWGDPTKAAIASSLAAEINGLTILKSDFEDAERNVTRFLIMAREPVQPAWPAADPRERFVTTFVFQVKSIPGALYKAMGGFATGGLNMTKLESYMLGGRFEAVRFYADVEGHPADPRFANAWNELLFFSTSVRTLGVYPAGAEREPVFSFQTRRS